MRGWRLALFSVLICLPALLIVAVGGWLVATHVPKAIRYEPSRIGREYRDVAEHLVLHPETATRSGERIAGMRQTSKINGVPWGRVEFGKRTLVWVQDGRNAYRGAMVETLRPFPHALVFYGGGSLVAFVLLGLSALAVAWFHRFSRERDDFLAATAHDLTTPLVGMRLMIGRNDEEARRLNERMVLIVSNIRDFLRLGGRRRKPEARRFDVVRLCREAYALFAADYEDTDGGAVTFDCAELAAGSLDVLADETLTLQILWNLLGNDLKYAAPHGRVGVRFRHEGARAVIEVADEGQGMTPRQMRRAFDRYYRARTVLESGKGGFGIGLCNAREFARLMGGDLTVRANDPRCCVFTLTLPATDERREGDGMAMGEGEGPR